MITRIFGVQFINIHSLISLKMLKNFVKIDSPLKYHVLMWCICITYVYTKHLGLCTHQARFITDTCAMVTTPTNVRQNFNGDGHCGHIVAPMALHTCRYVCLQTS